MKITETLEIVKKKNGDFTINNTIVNQQLNSKELAKLDSFYSMLKFQDFPHREILLNDKEEYLKQDYPILHSILYSNDNEVSETNEEAINNTPLSPEEQKKAVIKGLKNLINFFTEFDFEPNFRFVNTLSLALKKDIKEAHKYIQNYFELIDSPYINEINAKIKSQEFHDALSTISLSNPSKTVNKRFKIYYGSQGTGKTTIAMKETNNRIIVCNSSMLPADLMEDFVFIDGKATFKPSSLWRCMEEGTPIVLDEINLLPFDSLRFLQGILDGKTTFEYKGKTVNIKEGFQIIGTMNLTVNGMTYGLPEPLVDRCVEMKKFSLTASQLFNAIC